MGELITHIHHNSKLPFFFFFQITIDCMVFYKLEQQNENKDKQIF